MEPEITSTFFSNGERQLTVRWESPEGERSVLHELEDLINEYFAKLEERKAARVGFSLTVNWPESLGLRVAQLVAAQTHQISQSKW